MNNSRNTIFSFTRSRRPNWGRAGFTLTEATISLGVGAIVFAGAVTFLHMAGVSLSGITAQTMASERASHANMFIYSKVRLATSVTNDPTGNRLIVAFDDDYDVDSDRDLIPYNDHDRLEVFEFRNGDGNDLTIEDNALVYIPATNSSKVLPLIASGVAKLPGKPVFSVTNLARVILNYAVVDAYEADGYQATSVRSAVLLRNRPAGDHAIRIQPWGPRAGLPPVVGVLPPATSPPVITPPPPPPSVEPPPVPAKDPKKDKDKDKGKEEDKDKDKGKGKDKGSKGDDEGKNDGKNKDDGDKGKDGERDGKDKHDRD